MNYRILDKSWFKKHQNILLQIINFPILGFVIRSYLKIPLRKKIIGVLPDCLHFCKDVNIATYRGYTDWIISNKIARKFYLIFLLMHIWDLLVDTYVPELSFGFSSFLGKSETGSGASNKTCDGIAGRNSTISRSWNDIRNFPSAGQNIEGEFVENVNDAFLGCSAITYEHGTSYRYWKRTCMSFNLESVPVGSDVSNYKIVLYNVTHDMQLGPDVVFLAKWTHGYFGYNNIQSGAYSYPLPYQGDYMNWIYEPGITEGFPISPIMGGIEPGVSNTFALRPQWIKEKLGSIIGYAILFRADLINDHTIWSTPNTYSHNIIDFASAEDSSNPPYMQFDYTYSSKIVMVI